MAKKANFRLMAVMAIMVVLIGAGPLWADLADGLVAYWKLDGNATDSAGSNDGTLVNGPTWTTGKINEALSLDGMDDYVEIGDCLNNVNVPFSIATWINMREPRAHAVFASDNATSGNYYGFWLGAGHDYIDICYGDGTGRNPSDRRTKKSNISIPLNTWVFVVAIVRGPTDMDIYLNGVNVGGEYTGSGGNMVHNTNKAVIGDFSVWQHNYFSGLIDDVRIYDKALSDEEIENLYRGELLGVEITGPGEVAENFQAQYKAIANYERVDVDVTASANWSVEPNDIADIAGGLLKTEMVDLPTDITITAQYSEGDIEESAEKQVSILAICPGGSALEFDGVDDYVAISDDDSLDITNAISFSSWIYVYDTTADHQVIVAKWYGGYAYVFELQPNGKTVQTVLRGITSPGIPQVASDVEIEFNNWFHVAATYNGSVAKIYINGEETGSYITSGLIPATPAPLLIGAHNSISDRNPFNGIMDEVAIFNRALSAEEIQTLMHTRPETEEPNLVAYWDFDDGEGQVAIDISGNGNHGQLGFTEGLDDNDPNWVDSDAPVGICTLDGLVERNLNDIVDIKLGILEDLERALGKEDALLEYMDDAFHAGELDNLNKGDIVKTKQKIMTAIQQEQQAQDMVGQSADKLDDAMSTLGVE